MNLQEHVNYGFVEEINKEIARINSAHFEDINWYTAKGELIKLTTEEIEIWKFSKRPNWDFPQHYNPRIPKGVKNGDC